AGEGRPEDTRRHHDVAGSARVDQLLRDRVESHVALHLLSVRRYERAGGVEGEGAGPRIRRTVRAVQEKEAVALNRGVGRNTAGFDRALTEHRRDGGDTDTETDLSRVIAVGAGQLINEIPELHLTGLEADRVDVGKVVSDDAQCLGIGIEPRESCRERSD